MLPIPNPVPCLQIMWSNQNIVFKEISLFFFLNTDVTS